ncbi:MAG TPA: helix-turn-helix domain-containing protein [Methylomirabilota bacterium]|nr:helix-turn-helix domain-containing protein [Methylomirabilota bacterium]
MKTYGEYCAIAQALDVVGERWTLLIVRELLIQGACRYTDLRNGLPGIATNLLAERLREMEKAGLIVREDAAPPVATALFHLTERGAKLRPVVEALAGWGGPLVTRPIGDDEFRSHWLALPLELHLSDHAPERPPITIEVRAGDHPMLVKTLDGKVRARPGRAEHPDAVLIGTGSQVLGLLLGHLDLAEAKRRGLQFEGDPEVLLRVQPQPVAVKP